MIRTTGGSSVSSGGSPPNRRFHQQQQFASTSKQQQQQFPFSASSSSTMQQSSSSPVRAGSGARVRIVPEIFNDYNQIGLRQALNELDAALLEKCPVIVIEPMNLGDQTSRWIRIGNGLHKTAVLCGGASSIGFWIGDPFSGLRSGGGGGSGCVWYCVCGALAFVALSAHALHSISWQSDPCSYYQTETDPARLTRLLAEANYSYNGNGNGNGNNNGNHGSASGGGGGIQSSSVVVLVRKEVTGRRLLQNTAAACAAAVVLYRVYKSWVA